MHKTEHPIDLAAARKARAQVPPTAVGDRWADLHGGTHGSAPTRPGSGTVIRLRPGR